MPVSIGFTCCCDQTTDPPTSGCCCINGVNDPKKTTREDCLLAGGTWYDQPCEEVDCSGGGGGGGCRDGCEVFLPALGVISAWWEILSRSYDRATGNWTLQARTIAPGGFSSGAVYSQGGANAAVTSHNPPPNFGGGFGYPGGTRVTITGTSTPPTFANCGTWQFGLQTYAVVFLSATWTSAKCGVLTTCCPGKYIPTTLTIRVIGGACPSTGTMTWDGGAWRSGGAAPLSIDLSCVSGVWYLQVDFDATIPEVVCSPFSASAFFYGTQCGDIFVSITE
jgi:hypothetical protein